VIDGWTDQPVTAEASPERVFHGHGVVVKAPGYLPREQIYTGEVVALWPGDQPYAHDLAYSLAEFADGVARIVRWTDPFTITPEGQLAEDEAVHEKAVEVAGYLTECTGLPISVGPGGACRLKLDRNIEDQNAIAMVTFDSWRGPTITGATVTFAYRDEILGNRHAHYRNTLLHELGHVIGLAHSPRKRDVMTPDRGPGTRRRTFTEMEETTLHMMYLHREPGNQFPDRDPQLAAAALGAPQRIVIRDCRPPSGFRR
jgi:hypothetical protein